MNMSDVDRRTKLRRSKQRQTCGLAESLIKSQHGLLATCNGILLWKVQQKVQPFPCGLIRGCHKACCNGDTGLKAGNKLWLRQDVNCTFIKCFAKFACTARTSVLNRGTINCPQYLATDRQKLWVYRVVCHVRRGSSSTVGGAYQLSFSLATQLATAVKPCNKLFTHPGYLILREEQHSAQLRAKLSLRVPLSRDS